MAWTRKGAAENLSQHVGPGMWRENREKLEALANGDDEASEIARRALEHQAKYDSGYYDPNNSADPSDD